MRRISLLALCGVLSLAFALLAQAQVEFIIQYDDGTSVFYSGRPDPNDTCGVWFEPPTDCQILSGLFQFNSGMGGLADVYVWDIVDGFDPDNYFDTDEPAGAPGPRPIGRVLAGPIQYVFDNSGQWQEIVFEDWGYPPEDLDVGTNYFFLGYVLHETGFYPAILGDAADERPYHSLAWLTTPGGVHPTEPGWWAYGIDWMLRAKVNLYGDPPPFIEDLADPPDTYLSGPYAITATIYDYDASWLPGSGQVTAARIIYSVNSGDPDTVLMSNIGGDLYRGFIPTVPALGQINFWIEADDNAGHSSSFPNAPGYYFTYRQPSGATMLLVNDAGSHDGESLYRNALENAGYDYDFWYINPDEPMEDMGYPGSDVITANIYSSIIWYNAPAQIGSLPDNAANLAVDPVANFMDDGGNFFLSSSDYLGGAFNPDVWTEFTALPGTFMYEYLKVSNGWSDSHLNPHTGESLDTVYYGLVGDPVSGEFTSPFQNHPEPNYNDFAYARPGAVNCFFTAIDDEPAGIRYDGGYKMVFLPWLLDACDDSSIAQGILQNVLEYFDEGPGPQLTLLENSRYGIFGNTPHPLVAQITDPLGVFSAYAKFRWDGGLLMSEPMTLTGPNQYTYEFSAPADWNTLEYYVTAASNAGHVSVSPSYECWHTGLQHTPGADFIYCSDQPYEGMGGSGNYDSLITDPLTAMGVNYQLWDVDDFGTPDYWTVLSNFDNCFWVGYLDWNLTFPMLSADNPFSPFLAGGKNLLFSSEEQMGVWTGWMNTEFVSGDFAYDWLNVGYVDHDLGYDVLTVAHPVDPLCVGLPNQITLTTAGFPYGSMADRIDPNDPLIPKLFLGDHQPAGLRDFESDHHAICLGFCLFQMPGASRYTFIANVLDYFNQNLGLPEVSVEMTPQSPPIQIPASGGTFNFLISLTNNGGAAQSFDAWIKALLPNGSYYGPVLGPVALTVPAGGSLDRNRTQTVPGSAPAGNYSYIAYAGDYPNSVWDTDAFPFTKLTSGADGPFVSDWRNTGEAFDLDAVALPDKFALRGAYPNPFNASTRLTYDLPVACRVSLKVFDIQGRLVATLINGFRAAGSHVAVFDGADLSSGLYFFRLTAGDFTATSKTVLLK